MTQKVRDIIVLIIIGVSVIALCFLFISQNSSKTLMYGENGGIPTEEASSQQA